MQIFDNNNLSIHFIGIGGIGNSALAVYLKNLGFDVSGSDLTENETCNGLIERGIKIFYGHREENVYGKDIVIYSSAIEENNPELSFALKNKMAVYSRAQVLAMISEKYKVKIGVCGSHGKTTTCALITNILKANDCRFTAFIGGFDLNYSNTCNFGDEIFLAEICEYKRNIDLFSCDISVLLNVDNDHLDCYKNYNDLKQTFRSFYKRGKTRVINRDDSVLSTFKGSNITFGTSEGDFHAKNVIQKKENLIFDVYQNNKKSFKANVKLLGVHNVYNVLAAVAVAKSLGIENKVIVEGLKRFRGVKRRNEFLGRLCGATVYADYAHHPKEIKKSITAYLNDKSKSKIVFIFQPHTYSRTKLLFEDFVKAFAEVDNLFIYKTYPARESFNKEGDASTLSKSIPSSKYFEDVDKLMTELKKTVGKNDKIVILGAGDLYDIIKTKL